jgi:hypothetical protein
MRARVVRLTAAFQALLLMATLLVPALVAATGITTDLWVYQDGDTVTVTGVDYGPNEVVDFVTTDPAGVVVDSGSASSDDAGGVTYTFTLHVTVGGVYDVVGTGETSGLTATTQFDPPNTITTITSLTLGAASIAYGGSTTLSGSLAWAAGAYNQGQQSKDGRTIHLRSYTNASCSTGQALIQDVTTSGGGASGTASFSYNYTPTTAGARWIQAEFDGFTLGTGNGKDTYTASNSTPCQSLTVSKANTTTTGSTSVGSIFNTQSFTVDYSTSATVGLVGNTATGTITMVKDSGPGAAGTLGCTPASIALSQAQTAGGFSQSAATAFTCTPTGGAGTYTMHVQFTDSDGNYNNSASSTLTVVVKNPDGTSLSETLTPSTIFYGESTSISGVLTDTSTSSALVAFNVVSDSVNNPCNNIGDFIGIDATDGAGVYVQNYRPTSVGTDHIRASYSGDVSHQGATNCKDLVVNKAPTSVENALLSAGSITTVGSATVTYKVQSAYGVATHTANGTVSVVTDPGLTCAVGGTGVTAAQADANGLGAADAGFAYDVNAGSNPTREFTCSSATPGTYHLHVNYSGDGEYTGSDSATLTLVVTSSNTAPVLTVPASPVVAEATSAAGAVVTFSVTATDAEDNPDPTPTCDHTSGDTFSLGDTLVSCSVTDLGGLSDNDSFTVRVVDTSDPVVTISTAESDNGAGWYNLASNDATAGLTVDVAVSDAVGATSLTCTDNGTDVGPLSAAGDSFVVGDGVHTIDCTATDAASNSGSDSASYSVDQTNPSVTVTPARGVDYGTWYNAPVVFDTTGTDATSGVSDANCSVDDSYTGPDGSGLTVNGSCTDNAGNVGTGTSTAFDFDDTNPTITFVSRLPAANGYGWNNSAVTVTWSCSDATSGAVNASVTDTKNAEGAAQTAAGTCYDNANNSAGANLNNINIDLTSPTTPTFSSGLPADNGVYYFGFVPSQPTCSSSDALSGLVGCVVTGYSTAIGSHTMVATATDRAGNTSSASRFYTVYAWTLKGFYNPVDMGGVLNTIKGGQTVPLKFEVFAGATELTSTSYVKSFKQESMSCTAFTGFVADDVEITSTGGTTLRYDSTDGQFIQNWQTPKQAGTCWAVTMATLDGSSLTAYFKLK